MDKESEKKLKWPYHAYFSKTKAYFLSTWVGGGPEIAVLERSTLLVAPTISKYRLPTKFLEPLQKHNRLLFMDVLLNYRLLIYLTLPRFVNVKSLYYNSYN